MRPAPGGGDLLRQLVADRASAVARFPDAADLYERAGAEAVAALPLRVGGAVVGALALAWKESRTFTDDEAELLDALAALCAQALDRARALAAELLSEAAIPARRAICAPISGGPSPLLSAPSRMSTASRARMEV